VILQLIVAGYVYDVVALYGVDRSIRVSGQTLLAMSALAVALGAGRVGRGAFEIATRRTVGGTAARWLLPVALFLPPLLGALRLVAQREGWIASTETGVALFAVAQTLTLAAVVYFFARHLDVVERRYVTERRRSSELARLVAICAWTGRVRWKGEWVRVERFLEERFGVAVTHTISEEAFEAMERELDQWTPPNGER
jgi:putative intracellular protease/amidase